MKEGVGRVRVWEWSNGVIRLGLRALILVRRGGSEVGSRKESR